MLLKNDPAVQELLIQTYNSLALTAVELFPENFYSPFSTLHDQIFALLQRKTFLGKDGIVRPSNKKVIAAPRGIGKTTIVRTLCGRAILWNEVPFITYTSNSATVAEMQTENLKADLRLPRIKELFGDIKVAEYDGADETFGKKAWVAYGQTIIVPRGFEQQHRGLNWRGHRPTLLIFDDLEDKDFVQNEDNRKKLKNRFFSDMEKCINRYKKDYVFVYIDTLKHEDSLLALLLESSDWDSLNLSICDENYHSYAPDYMSDEEIAVEVDSHREKGTLDEFYREYMNIPISTEDATFMSRYFRYYEEVPKDDARCGQLVNNTLLTEPLSFLGRLENVIIVDPAKTVKLHSAESAIIGIGFDRLSNRIFIRDLVAKKLHPDELYDEAFAMALNLRAKVLAVEITGLNEFITYPFKTEITKRGLNIEFFPLNARGKKEDRIAQLVPFYRKGEIYHNRNVCGPLEAQLLSFPRSKRWDCMDAEAYFIELLERAERYFYSDDDEEPLDDEAMPDDLEPAIIGWRAM